MNPKDLISVFSSMNNPVGYTSGAIFTAHDNMLHSFKLNLENITSYDFTLVSSTELDFQPSFLKSIKNRGQHKILAYDSLKGHIAIFDERFRRVEERVQTPEGEEVLDI